MSGVPATLHVARGGSGGGLQAKRERLRLILREMGRTMIAYSGGVDSTLLLAEARGVLGEGAVGVIARSASLAAAELDLALRTASDLGAPVQVLETHEIDRPGYRANAGDRCYHCKAELFDRLTELAAREGFDSLAYGAVTDDLGEIRPGMSAAGEFHVRAPLIEAGLSKVEVRLLARERGLRVWDKPQSACLASRIPTGSEVTEAKLRQVEGAEAWVRTAFGTRVLRVRHVGDTARVEVAPEDVPLMKNALSLAKLHEGLQQFGFNRVEVDPRGYRRPDPIPALSGDPRGEADNGDRG